MTKYVVRHNNAWAVKNPQAEKVTKTFATQKEAIEYAKSLKKQQVLWWNKLTDSTERHKKMA